MYPGKLCVIALSETFSPGQVGYAENGIGDVKMGVEDENREEEFRSVQKGGWPCVSEGISRVFQKPPPRDIVRTVDATGREAEMQIDLSRRAPRKVWVFHITHGHPLTHPLGGMRLQCRCKEKGVDQIEDATPAGSIRAVRRFAMCWQFGRHSALRTCLSIGEGDGLEGVSDQRQKRQPQADADAETCVDQKDGSGHLNSPDRYGALCINLSCGAPSRFKSFFPPRIGNRNWRMKP